MYADDIFVRFENEKNLKTKTNARGNYWIFIIKQIKKPQLCSTLL